MTADEIRHLLNDQKLVAIPAAICVDDRITPIDVRLLLAIASYAKGSGECHRPNRVFAHHLGCDERTVARSLARIVDAGWLTIEKDEAPPAYRVLRLSWSYPEPPREEKPITRPRLLPMNEV